MNFDTAFELLIGHEGGYVNNPADPGGETKYGISKRSYPKVDIANLTLADAKAIYLRDFWEASLAHKVSDPLSFQLFDTAVNSGPHQSIALLQLALGVASDGKAGPVTMAAILSRDPKDLTIGFIAQRLRYMTGLSTWSTFGKGWARRIAANLEQIGVSSAS